MTNSSVVVPQGSWQSENGVNLSRRNGDVTFDDADSRVRFSMTPCLEILPDVPIYFAALHGAHNSGFSDAAPAAKWQISSCRERSISARRPEPRFPTGTRAIAGRGVRHYLQWPWSWDLGGGWSIAGMLMNTLTPADAHNKILSETTFLVERALAERAFIFIEYVSDYRVHGGPALFECGRRLPQHASPADRLPCRPRPQRQVPTHVLGVGYSVRVDGLF